MFTLRFSTTTLVVFLGVLTSGCAPYDIEAADRDLNAIISELSD